MDRPHPNTGPRRRAPIAQPVALEANVHRLNPSASFMTAVDPHPEAVAQNRTEHVTESHDTHTLIHIRPTRGAVVLNPDGSIAYYKRNQIV